MINIIYYIIVNTLMSMFKIIFNKIRSMSVHGDDSVLK